MKVKSYPILMILFVFLLASCMQDDQKGGNNPPPAPEKDGTFGKTFNPSAAVPAAEVTSLFEEGKNEIDNVIVEGYIPASCTGSGCWMDVDITGDMVMNVTFRDGDFTIPLDAAGKTAVMNGTAYRELVPAERLRAYAKDEGKSDEEIAAITEDGWVYTFVADGVVLK
jgi:hypothetical protein